MPTLSHYFSPPAGRNNSITASCSYRACRRWVDCCCGWTLTRVGQGAVERAAGVQGARAKGATLLGVDPPNPFLNS
eukprot:1160264-Pelagomonas_calceolata.AAC.11